MRQLLFFIFLFSVILTEAQGIYIPPQNGIPDTTYQHYAKELAYYYYKDSISPSWDSKHGMFICYYHLNAPADTVFRYLDIVRYYDPVQSCWMQEEEPSGVWTVKNKRLEPRRDVIMKRFCDSVDRTFDSVVIRTLDTMNRDDQKFRKSIEDEPWIKGNEKKWVEQHLLDSINEEKLAVIIGRMGYPGKNIVGMQHRDIAFMVIQHAELHYQEKYMSIVERAAKEDQMERSNLPMMIDRINMRRGIPQIYGTQGVWNPKRKVMELYKVQSLKDVNKLRAEYNMEPLRDYLMRNHIEFPISTH
jgi:hypothetical protein